MPEFEHKPTEKIVIHDITALPFDEFVRIVVNDKIQHLLWGDGVLFVYYGYPHTPEIVKDKIAGIEHWDTVIVTKMEKYQDRIQRKDMNFSAPVNKAASKDLIDFVHWIKTKRGDLNNIS